MTNNIYEIELLDDAEIEALFCTEKSRKRAERRKNHFDKDSKKIKNLQPALRTDCMYPEYSIDSVVWKLAGLEKVKDDLEVNLANIKAQITSLEKMLDDYNIRKAVL